MSTTRNSKPKPYQPIITKNQNLDRYRVQMKQRHQDQKNSQQMEVSVNNNTTSITGVNVLINQSKERDDSL